MPRRSTSTDVPAALRPIVEQIHSVTDPFCAEHLDAEYATLVRRVVALLARKRPSPLLRGDLRVWAGAAIYVVGSMNFLFDRSQTPHLSGDDVSALIGVPKSTLSNKAAQIRRILGLGSGLGSMTPELCRRELVERFSLFWMVQVNGMIVDVRSMPPAIQHEAYRKGYIPWLPGAPPPAE